MIIYNIRNITIIIVKTSNIKAIFAFFLKSNDFVVFVGFSKIMILFCNIGVGTSMKKRENDLFDDVFYINNLNLVDRDNNVITSKDCGCD